MSTVNERACVVLLLVLSGAACSATPPPEDVEAETTALVSGPSNIAINAGGPAVAPFVADTNFTGGGTLNHANVIDLSGVTSPAPMAVYQTGRTGTFSYSISGFAAGSSHVVRLHFAETYFSTVGARTFNVAINGTTVLPGFDIFKMAGAKNRAYVAQLTAAADASGKYTIQATSVVNVSLISGIEITGSCTPTTCSVGGKNCGSIPDGCGGTLNCGTCPAPSTCGGSGIANICGCTPTTCAAQGKNCGSIPDGCGGTLSCGACVGGQTCGGGGTANVCSGGCTPTTCTAQGKNCGAIPDGCGGTLNCGACVGGQTCGGGGTANVCGCTRTTCCAQNKNCGTIPDGCGNTLDCGTCAAPQTCGAGGVNICG